MGDLGSFRSRSSRDCIERRRQRLSRPPVGGRDPNRSIHDGGAVLQEGSAGSSIKIGRSTVRTHEIRTKLSSTGGLGALLPG
jgi:hypothetical protein